MPHRLSIIIVTYNEARHIARLAESIRQMDLPGDVTVESVVVDGGSRDGTAEAAKQAGIGRVIEAPGANIPKCRNLGLAAASGDWVAFVDGDCEVAPDWLRRSHPILKAHDPVLLGWPAAPPEPMTWVQAAWRFHWTRKNPRTEPLDGVPVIRHEGFRLATTRNMLLTKSAADRVGGFKEELDTGEDTDFAYRVYLAGIPVLGLPGLHVVHHGEPATLARFFRQQLWHANRRSYRHIMKLSGGKVGANAPRFAALFLACLLLAAAGLVSSLITDHRSLITLSLPLVLLIAAPAALLSWRGRTARHFLPLCALYTAYGLARALDFAGLHPHKPSWKAAQIQ